MNFRHIEVILAIMKSGSITGAARMLHVSQPNITRVLNHAEQQLQFSLFERRRHGLVPTTEACLLIPEFEGLMSNMQAIEDRVVHIQKGASQRLRIATVPALAQSLVPETLIALHDKYPHLSIELTTLHFDGACDQLISKQIDVALVFANESPTWSRSEVIYKGRLVAVSPKSLTLPKERISLNELTQHRMILIPENDPLGTILNGALVKYGLPTDSDYQIKTYSVLADLIAAGAGVGVVDPFTAWHYRDSINIVPIEPTLSFNVCLLHHMDTPLSSVSSYFLKILRSSVSNINLIAVSHSTG